MSQNISPAFVPSAMEEKLTLIRRHQAAVTILRAIAIGASVLCVSMLMAMLVDWQFTLFDSQVRFALTAVSLLCAIGAVVTLVVPVWQKAFQKNRAAAIADSRIPQLEERWQTVVALTKTGAQPASGMADAMLRLVISEAAVIGRLVDPRRVVETGELRKAGKSLLFCLLLLVGFLLLDWSQTSVLLRRYWAPLANISATSIRSSTGDVSAPRGTVVELVAQLSGIPRKSAVLTIVKPGMKPENIELVRDRNRTNFFLHRVAIEESFQYRLRAGDGQTEWHHVTVVDYPSLAEIRFRVVSPAYLNRPDVEKTVFPNRIKVMQGSMLYLEMRPKAELQRMELTIAAEAESVEQSNATSQTISLTPEADGWYRHQMQLIEDVSLTPALWNSYGLTNEDATPCRIQVIADKAPVVRVLASTKEMAVAADGVVDIRFEADDDHGISKAELLVYEESTTGSEKESKILKVLPIPLGDQELRKHVSASMNLDMKLLHLKPGTQISYAVRVTDNRMSSPESGTAEESDASVSDASRASDRASESMSSLASDDDDGGTNPSATNSSSAVPDGERPDGIDRTADQIAGSTPNEEKARAETSPDDTPADVANNDKPVSSKEGSADKSTKSSVNDDSDGVANDSSKSARTDRSTNRDDEEAKEADQAVSDANGFKTDANPQTGEEQPSEAKETSSQDRMLAMAPQQSEDGQNAETNRQRLKVTEPKAGTGGSRDPKGTESADVRQQILEINEILTRAEIGLTLIVKHEVSDDDRQSRFKESDEQLGTVESLISDVRQATRETSLEFVGLQLMDGGHSYVTPARELVFSAIREPVSDDHARNALQLVTRARESFAVLLNQYERIARDQRLAQSLKQGIKMYEVYVKGMQGLRSESRQIQDPLERKMQILELNQEYLDRFAEVQNLQTELMKEFGRLLSDDPRLLARYIDLFKNRRNSLKTRLTELAKLQNDTFQELSNWIAADDSQKDELWSVAVEQRMQVTNQLIKETADLAERFEKLMPLVLESNQGTPARLVETARRIAATARDIPLEVGKDSQQRNAPVSLGQQAAKLAQQFHDMDTLLDQLSFEYPLEEDVTTYVNKRFLECRAIADQVESVSQIAEQIHKKQFHGLLRVDQYQIAMSTELLRVDMLFIRNQLNFQFQQLGQTPALEEVFRPLRELREVMEEITFEQTGATFALTKGQLTNAGILLKQADDDFARAEELLDQVRRKAAEALDETSTASPNVADLIDPKLDDFLARLEREPNIESALGIPDRPVNLRVISDTKMLDEQSADDLDKSAKDAEERADNGKRMTREAKSQDEKEQSEQERARRQEAKESEAALAKALAEYKERSKDSSTTPAELKKLQQEIEGFQRQLDQINEQKTNADWKRMEEELQKSLAALKETAGAMAGDPEKTKQLEQVAAKLERLLEQMRTETGSEQRGKLIAEFERQRAILKSILRGDRLVDTQWNKLMSTLDNGLWQVGGRTLPEEYRKPIELYQQQIRRLMNGSEDEGR